MRLLGPVVEPGPRRRPAEPQIVGSNPTRPASNKLPNFRGVMIGQEIEPIMTSASASATSARRYSIRLPIVYCSLNVMSQPGASSASQRTQIARNANEENHQTYDHDHILRHCTPSQTRVRFVGLVCQNCSVILT